MDMDIDHALEADGVVLRHGRGCGDAAVHAILHLHPAAAGYDREAALAEARAVLAGRPYVRRDEAVTLRRLA